MDSDKYASCPYCAKAENGTGDLVTEALRPQASLRKPERERTETLAAPKQESELRPQATAPGGTGFSEYSDSNRSFLFGDCVGTGRSDSGCARSIRFCRKSCAGTCDRFYSDRVEEAAESAPQISSYGGTSGEHSGAQPGGEYGGLWLGKSDRG